MIPTDLATASIPGGQAEHNGSHALSRAGKVKQVSG